MAQEKVVDVAALSRIGRQSTYEGKEPNRSMDRFLEFAGGYAVKLFANAWENKKQSNKLNREFLSEKTTDLRDLSPDLKSIVQSEYDNIGGILSEGVSDEYGLFNTPITKAAKDRVVKGVDNQTNAKNRALNIHENTKSYSQSQKKHYSIHLDGEIIDEDGVSRKAGWGAHNLPENFIFTQAFANGITDKFITYNADGKMGMNSNVIDMLQRGELLQVEANSDFIKELNKTGEFIPVEDWPIAKVDESDKGNNIMNGIDGLTIDNGVGLAWNENVHSKLYSNFISTSMYGDGGKKAGMNDNEIGSYFFGGKGSNNRPMVEDFIENPGFDVMIDHDGDENTPDVLFDGTAGYMKRTFGDLEKNMNLTFNSTKEALEWLAPSFRGQYEVWKQGIINELKTVIDPRDANLTKWMEGQFMSYAKEGHEDVWDISKNNPKNAITSDLEKEQLKQLRRGPQVVNFEFGSFKAPTTEAQLEDYSVVNQIAGGQNIVKIGHDTYEKQSDGKYKLTKSTQRGTVEYIETDKSYTKTQMIQEHGNVYGNIPNNFVFWDDIDWIKWSDVKEGRGKKKKEGAYYHDDEDGKYYKFSGGEYIEIYRPKK